MSGFVSSPPYGTTVPQARSPIYRAWLSRRLRLLRLVQSPLRRRHLRRLTIADRPDLYAVAVLRLRRKGKD